MGIVGENDDDGENALLFGVYEEDWRWASRVFQWNRGLTETDVDEGSTVMVPPTAINLSNSS